MIHPFHARLSAILRGLEALPPSASFVEALSRISQLITDYEDAHSGLPNEPGKAVRDGRIYPPDPRWGHRDGAVTVFRHNPPHQTRIADNGAFDIFHSRDQRVLVSVPGQDGHHVRDLLQPR